MPRTIYALLVGIDDYPSPVPRLRGCVNDIEAFATYLSERVARDKRVKLDALPLTNGKATRRAVVDAFRNHLGKAGKDDVALFYYSGHGSQQKAPEEFWAIEPDHLDETLVLYDSRCPGSWDLADKEIAKMIGDVAANGPHVAVILDCCHSGSGTREVGTTVRRAPIDHRRRPIESFLVTPAEVKISSASRSLRAESPSRYSPPQGRHVLFASCRDDEEAKEYNGDGKTRGAFSFFLGDALKNAAGVPTYRDLFSRTSALVSNMRLSQSPQLEATQNEDLDATFLDGTIQAMPTTFTATYRDGHWTLSAGATSGIAAPVGSDAARVALFPFAADAAILSDPAQSMAMARIDQVLPATSRLVIDHGAKVDRSTTYKAMIVSMPAPPLGVLLEGDAKACAWVRDALRTASPEGKPSLFICESSSDAAPEFRLLARNNQFVITRPNDERPLVGQIDGLSAASARRAVERLEHIARWTQTARLKNAASSIQPGDVKLTILVNNNEVTAKEIRLEYTLAANRKEVEPSFKVSMTNNSQRTLFCGLLDLTQRYRVSAGLLSAGCVKLEPRETAWAYHGKPIPTTVPKEVWDQGVIEYRDLLKLLICTDEFDARLLEQPSLDMPRAEPSQGITRGGTRGISRDGSLNRLMRKIQSRDVGESESAVIDDWHTMEVSFTTVRPLPVTPVPQAGQPAAALQSGVKLSPHSQLKANARLSSEPLATRDLCGLRLPPLLGDDPRICQPLVLTVSRGSDPGLSVLELSEVNDPTVVTPDAPLVVTVPVQLQPNEHVLPVAYDGEFFLPLGRVNRRSNTETEIVLERLTPPLADSRSQTGAIKIFFQKVSSKEAGLELAGPTLAVAEVAADGTVAPIRDAGEVRDRVSKARRILLFVHGIIGDTESMARSVQLAKLTDERPLSAVYDVVLTYDYDNLNTTIEENGRLLKTRLEAAGLGPGHDKTLEIAAHSTGGLVSRWFIEREGGSQIVDRLVMLGTPNGGLPWPGVVDWATLALALGLNHLTALAWPASVVGGFAALMENSALALNEMLTTEPMLSELNKSPDPQIPYVMIAGSTSLIPPASASPEDGKPSAYARLVSRLGSPGLIHEVASRFFLEQPNDVAVSVASMEYVAPGRKQAFEVHPVACDHFSYFRDPPGLKVLAEVLERES
jgi:hypothetical protein